MTSKVIEGHKSYSFCLKIKILRGNSCSPSLSSPLLLFLSLCLFIFSLSLVLLLSFSFFHQTPPPLNQPYIHPMPLYLFSLSCSSPLFLTSSSLHRPYIHPMNLYLFSLPRSSSPSIFNLTFLWTTFCPCFILKPVIDMK